MNTRWWTSSMGLVEIQVPEEAIEACSHSGPCDQDVAYWYPQVNWSGISRENLVKELEDYGVWDSLDTDDIELLKERIFWIACGDLSDERESQP